MQISNQTTIVVRFFGNGYGTHIVSLEGIQKKEKKKEKRKKKRSLLGCYFFFDLILPTFLKYGKV